MKSAQGQAPERIRAASSSQDCQTGSIGTKNQMSQAALGFMVHVFWRRKPHMSAGHGPTPLRYPWHYKKIYWCCQQAFRSFPLKPALPFNYVDQISLQKTAYHQGPIHRINIKGAQPSMPTWCSLQQMFLQISGHSIRLAQNDWRFQALLTKNYASE